MRHGFHFSKAQMLKLRKGGSVRMTHEQLQGPHSVEVHPHLHKKVLKALRDKKGLVIHAPMISGAGWLSDAGSWLKKNVLPAAEQVFTQAVLPRLEKKGEELATRGFTKLGLGVHPRRGVRLLRPVRTTSGVPVNFEGTGHRRHPRHHMKGGNFFDDVWGGIKKGANWLGEKALPVVVDKALPIAVNYGTKALLGAGREHRGRGLFPPGNGAGLYAPGHH